MKPEDFKIKQGYQRPVYSPDLSSPLISTAVNAVPTTAARTNQVRMQPADDSLNQPNEGLNYNSSLETPATNMTSATMAAAAPFSSSPMERLSVFKFNRRAFSVTFVTISFIILVGVGSYVLSKSSTKVVQPATQNSVQPTDKYNVGTLPLQGLQSTTDLEVAVNHLAINGQLQVNDTLVIAPSTAPSTPVAGQIYYDSVTNQPYYYNGAKFVSLDPTHVTSIGSSNGVITLGQGLQISGNQLSVSSTLLQSISNAGLGTPTVKSLQGLTGDLAFTGGNGITITGTTITNSGVVSLTSSDSSIAITNNGNGTYNLQSNSVGGVGINVTGTTITNAGVVSLGSSDSSITITANGNGAYDIKAVPVGGAAAITLAPASVQSDATNYSTAHINKTGSGNFLEFASNGINTFVVSQTGQITSGSINYNQILGLPAEVSSIGGSSGAIVTGTGLNVTGNTISNTGVTGLTGTVNQISVSAATGNITLSLPQDISAASSPTFNGLTLSTALSLGNGGTGSTTSNGARTNLGAAASGVNSDITSLTGLSTPLSAAQGGTGVNGSVAGNGKVLIGNGSGYTLSNITAGSGITITNGAGSITIDSTGAIGTAGGDLTGSYPNPTIAKLQGKTITISGSPLTGAVVQYNGTGFVDGLISNGNLSAGTFNSITGTGALSSGSIASGFGNIDIGANTFTGNGSGITSINASNVSSGTLNDLRLSSNVTLQGNTFNGPSELVQLDASSQLPAVSGALVTSLNGTSISSGTVANARLVSSGTLTVAAGNGLSGGGSVALGGTTTLNVAYGSIANTAVQGNVQFTCPTGGTNLTGGGNVITEGAGGTCTSLSVVNSPSFSGSITTGVAGTTNGAVVFDNSSNAHITTVQGIASGTQDQTITIPASSATTDTVCLVTLGNCAGSGAGVITSGGTQNYITKYTNGVANQIGNSLLFDNGVSVGVGTATPNASYLLDINGNAHVTGLTTLSGGLTASGTITLSGLNTAGVVHNNASGVLSTSAVALGSDTSGNYVDSIGLLTGLTTTGNTGAGSTPTLSVTYGSAASTSVQGNTNLTISAGTGLTGGGTITLGSGGTATLNVAYGSAVGTAVAGNTTYTCPSGTGNLTGGGTVITAGTGGTCANLTVINNPTFSGLITGNAGLTVVGATSINATGTASTSLGNATGTFSLASSGLNVTTAGAITGATTISTSSDINTTAGSFQINGNSLNTAGTLSNVAYLNQGNTFTTGTNTFSAAGTAVAITNNATVGGTLNGQTISATAVFTGTLSVNGGSITTGVAGTTDGSVSFANSLSTRVGVLQAANPSGIGNATFNLPSIAGGTTDTVCLVTLGNCAGSGGGITGSGSIGTISKFSATGAITNSSLTESGTTLTASGNLTIQGTNSLNLGIAGTNAGSISFNNDAVGGTHTVTLQAPASDPASNLIFKLPSADGGSGNCLQTNGSGVLSFNACTGGGAGGVTSLDTQGGVLTLANSSGSGGTITIDNASTTQKGIAQFNSTNFSASTGIINTIQDIATTSSPTFTNLTVQGATGLTIGSSTNLGNASFLDGTVDGFTSTLSTAVLTANRNITLPNNSGTVCLENDTNCGFAPASGSSSYLQLQATTPGTAQTGNSNITGTAIAGSFSGSGASLTSLNGTNISSGTVADARLTTNVTLQGNTFNGVSQLVQTTAGGILPVISGANLTSLNGSSISSGTVADARLTTNVTLQGNTFNGVSQLVQTNVSGELPAISGVNLTLLNGSNIASGTVADARLSTNVTLQGNTFNGVSQLVQTTAGGILPVISGANLTSLNGSNISSGTVADARLSTNVALLNGTGPQTFTGNNKFTGTLLSQNASNSTSAFQVQNAAGTGILSVDTSNSRIGINTGASALTADLSFGNGANRTLNVLATPSGAGNSLTISAGASSDTSNGGDLNLQGGANGTGVGVGGNVNITSGNAGGNNNGEISGSISISTPSSTNGGSGGITLSTASDRTATGNVSITTGTSAIDTAGSFSVTTGNSAAIGTAGGAISLTVGNALNVNPETGGAITLTAGGASNSASGGAVTITTGAGGASAGTSGTLTLGTGATTGGSYGSTLFTQGGTTVASIISGGATTFKNSANSAAAFQVQNSAGTALLTADTTNGQVILGTASTLTGTIQFKGSGGVGTLNVTGPTTPNAGNFTLSIPAITANSNICTDNLVCTGYAASSGSGSYIQNQNAGQQASSNFWISGSGRADTSLLTPTLDTASAVALAIGNINASSINLGNTTNNIATIINGTVLVKTTTGHDSTTAFQVQNAAGTAIFNTDTAGSGVTIAGQLHISGSNQMAFDTTAATTFFGNFANPGGNAVGFSVPGNVLFGFNTSSLRTGFGGTTTYFASNNPNALAEIRGKADEVQLNVEGYSTQTNDIVDVKKSDGTLLFNVQNSGNVGIGTTSPGANLTVKTGINTITAFQVQNASATPVITVDTTNQQTIFQSGSTDAVLAAASVDTASAVQDLNTGSWTSTNWTTAANSATHVTGNTSALTNTGFTPTIGTTYQVSYTYSLCSSANTLGITFAGVTLESTTSCVGSNTKVITAASTANLVFTPNSTYVGVVSGVKIQALSTQVNTALAVKNSSGTVTLEVRSSGSTSNVFIGLNSGKNNTSSGTGNTALGNGTLQSNTTGGANTAIGNNSLQSNSTGFNNTATGFDSLQFNTTGSWNTANGELALQNNTTGSANIAVGVSALQLNTAGGANVAIGNASLYKNTSGGYNTAAGSNALYNNTIGGGNVALGNSAAYYNTTGIGNTATGNETLFNNSIGNFNTANGDYALRNLATLTGTISATVNNAGNAQFTSTSTTGLVAGAIVTISGTTSYNGSKTILTVDDATHFTISTAYSTADATGAWTTAITNGNTAVGYSAGIGGNVYTAVGNSLFGWQSGVALQTGANYNTLMGYSAGSGITTGTNNLLLGYNAGTALTIGSNNVGIGQSVAFASNTGSNQLQIGAGISGDLALGTLVVKTVTNSTAGFQVKNASGTPVLTVDTTTGAITTSSTINTATISGGTLSGGNVSGGTLTGTAVNSLNVSGTAISSTGTLTVDANGANTISIGATSTGDILLGGGSGFTGCTITNATGALACTAGLQGTTLTSTAANGLTLGTASSLTGGIIFNGSGGAGTLTVVGPTTPNAGNFTLSIPAITANSNICTDNLVCTGYAASSGSGSYIQNQNAGQQSASNFWISGSGRADTSLLTPTLDTTSAVALNIGTSSSAINLNQSTLLTGNLSLASGANRTISVATPGTNTAGNTLTVSAGNGGAGATGVAGANLILTAGSAAGTTGAAAGGNTILKFGAGINGGAAGTFNIQDSAGNNYFQFDTSSTAGTTNAFGGLTCGLFFSNSCAIKGGSGLILVASQSGAAIDIDPGTAGAIVKASSNTVTALVVKNSAAASILNVDTVNNRLAVNTTVTAMTVPSGVTLAAIAGGSLAATTTYYYKVTAIDSSGGETTPSTEVSVATTGTNKTITLYWSAVTGASGYKIYRGTATNTEVYLVTVLSNYTVGSPYADDGTIVIGTTTVPGTNTAYTDTSNSNSSLQVSVGGNGTGTGQLYVGGVVPATVAGSVDIGLNPTNVTVNGQYAYTANIWGNSISIVNINNPLSLKKVASISVGANPTQVVVSGRYAYVTNSGGASLQILDISNPNTPTSVSTITTDTTPNSVAVSGRYAYVVNSGTGSLQVIDVSNPAVPSVVGSVATGAGPNYIVVSGRYAYVTNGTAGTLQIFDLINPVSPVSVGSVSAGTTPMQLAVNGRYAYVVNYGSASLQIFDVSNPASPVSVSTVSTSGNNEAISLSGRYAYLVGGSGSLQTIDISNPASAYVVGSVTTSTWSNGVTVSGRYAYVSSGGLNKLLAYDLGGTYSQTLESGSLEVSTAKVQNDAFIGGNLSVQTGLTVGGASLLDGSVGVNGIATFKNKVNSTASFQVQNAAGVALLNTDTTNQRVSVGSIGTATGQLYVAGKLPTAATGSVTTGANPRSVVINGRYAYAVNYGASTLQIINVSNPASPAVIGSVATGTNPTSVVVSGRYAYVTNITANNLQIFDVSNPAAPVSVSTITTSGGPSSVAVNGRYAYVANEVYYNSAQFQIFDVSNPAVPTLVSQMDVSYYPNTVTVSGRYAYFTSFNQTLQVVDISNPAAPVLKGSAIANGGAFGKTRSTIVIGRYAYATDDVGQLLVYDISNPSSPTIVGSVATGTTPQAVAVSGRYAYVSNSGSATLQMFDISNPASPTSIGTVTTGSTPISVAIDGLYAYSANYGANTLQVFDIGGTYTQALEVGSTSTTTLAVQSDAAINGGLSINNGLNVGGASLLDGSLGVNGFATFKNKVNSTTAFQVQDSSANTILAANTVTSGGGNLITINAPNSFSGNLLNVMGNSASRLIVSNNGSTSITSPSINGPATLLALTPGNNTSITYESPNINLVANQLTLTGTYATQRFSMFGQSTVTAASALSISSEADTLSVSGAPIAAGSATIASSVGLRVYAGTSVGAGVTNAYGLYVSAPTGATNNYAANFQGTSITALQVQNASGTATFTTDTSNGQIILGAASAANGQLKVLNATNANSVTIVSGATSASYTLTLPLTGPAVSQCLQSDATTASQLKFASCASSHSKTVVLAAEYAGAVLDAGTGSNNSGTITSGIDLTNRENYYKWVTTQATSQSYDVDIQVPIPSDFSSWGGTPVSIDTYTTDTTNGTLQAEARDATGTVETSCNFVAITPSANNTWQTKTGCTIAGTYSAGGYMTLRLRMYSTSAVTAVRIGNITLSYNSAY